MEKYGAIQCPKCGSTDVHQSPVVFQDSTGVRESDEVTEISKTAEITSEVSLCKCADCKHTFSVVR